MTGITLALLLSITRGTGTRDIAILLAFIAPKLNKATLRSPQVNDFLNPSGIPDCQIIIPDNNAAIEY